MDASQKATSWWKSSFGEAQFRRKHSVRRNPYPHNQASFPFPPCNFALRDLYGGSSCITDMHVARTTCARAASYYGQLVVWGAMKLVVVCSSTHVHCLLDGDQVASSRIGSVLLDKATRLSRHGLVCSIAKRRSCSFEKRAVSVLQWPAELGRSCDPSIILSYQSLLV